MTLKVRAKGGVTLPGGGLFVGGLLEEHLADSENESLGAALAKLGRRFGVKLVRPVDAKGRAVDVIADVFSAWLEHGDAAGGFADHVEVTCEAEAIMDEATREAQDIYDILGDSDE